MPTVASRPLTAGSVRTEPAVRLIALFVMLLILGLITWHITLKAREMSGAGVIYTVVVSSYLLSRFALAAAYRTPRDAGIEPGHSPL